MEDSWAGYNLAVTAEEKRLLQEQGYLIVRGVMDPAWLEELRETTARLLEEEGADAGGEFRKEAGSDRLANLVDKGECFERLVSHPLLLEAAEAVLGPDWKLSSLNYRAALPGDRAQQPLHCDMGLLPDGMGNAVFNSIWMLDDFTPGRIGSAPCPTMCWRTRMRRIRKNRWCWAGPAT
jgi:hypothetical protein